MNIGLIMPKRHKKYKFEKAGRKFYTMAVAIFAILTLITLGACIFDKITLERVMLTTVNAWFTLFAMNHYTLRYKRDGERAFWHDWFIFRTQYETVDDEAEENLNEDDTDQKKSA